ncbi:DUF7697 family protein [Salipiger mucosus]|uniref:Uncharacterized protein n=1 Tax=Salipiger mucosus DSM 16094 TaxID=1123237 RepID=S9QR50_9RHOB|nr:hypothetical protein [Salipiger mucosus]EPX82102.1 hypothetical protein Salmuc_02470 [Salipiger mucosus DSM 16094]
MSHCAGCRDAPGFSCERFGGKGACPEDTHAPRSVEGRAIAAAGLEIFHQRRVGPGGYAGLDMPACLALTRAQGIPDDIASLLLPSWEAGLLEAAAKQREDKDA